MAPKRQAQQHSPQHSPEVSVDVPEADMIEQRQPVVAEPEDDPADLPFEASEADVLDQHRDVALDDELRADDFE